MPIKHIVLNQGTLVYARAYGTLTTEDLMDHERAIIQEKHLQSGFKQLLDCRWAQADLVDADVVALLSQLHARHASQLRGVRCGVVTHNPVWFQVGSSYDCDHCGTTMIAFNDPSTACIWLGVDYQEIAAQAGPEMTPPKGIRLTGAPA